MKKKILPLLMALVMVAGLAAVPAKTANAASNKGIVVPVNLKDNYTWESVDWENDGINPTAWGADDVTLSSNATLSYTLYFSKGMFDKEGYGDDIHIFQVNHQINLHDENGYIGSVYSTDGLEVVIYDGECAVFARKVGEDERVDTSAWASFKEVGDYVVLTVKDCPLGGNIIDWDDNGPVFTPIDYSRPYYINVPINITPVLGVGGDGIIILDDVQVKDSGKVLYSEDFEGSENCADIRIGDQEDGTEVKGTAYTTSILSLKSKKADIKVGKSAKINATAFDGATITYKSNKPKVASVDKNGNVKGLKKGKAVIFVSCMGKTLKYTVKVS